MLCTYSSAAKAELEEGFRQIKSGTANFDQYNRKKVKLPMKELFVFSTNQSLLRLFQKPELEKQQMKHTKQKPNPVKVMNKPKRNRRWNRRINRESRNIAQGKNIGGGLFRPYFIFYFSLSPSVLIDIDDRRKQNHLFD